MEANTLKDQKKQAMLQNLAAAFRGDEGSDVEKAFNELAEYWEKQVKDAVSEVESRYQGNADAAILASRGCRVLTSKEYNYFENLIKKMKEAKTVKDFEGLDDALPESEMNQIFEEIEQSHPLLQAINFTYTSALTKIIVNTQGVQMAVWGELTSAITKELEGGIEVKDSTLAKLTAFMPISRDMLDLGPVWVERYVRGFLIDALALGLENGYVNGKGIGGEPIGMIRSVAPDVSVNQVTGYPEKQAIELTAITPETYGAILAQLAVSPTNRQRTISEVVLIVSPVDYFTKIMPATTAQALDGTYKSGIFPFPTRVIQSEVVEPNKAIIGIAKKYFAGLGKGSSKGGKIEYSDEFKFLDDARYYKIKLYGAGFALDDNAFKVLDISELRPTPFKVKIVGGTPIIDSEEPVAEPEISLDKETLTLTAGGNTATLEATVAPAGAEITEVNWASDDDTIASVTQDPQDPLKATVTPLTAGTCKISVLVDTVYGECTAECDVTVEAVEEA